MGGLHSGTEVFRHRGVKMLGILNRPDRPRGKFPAVLFLHGFPGSEKSVDIQRALLDRGIGSLSLHFSGAWGSEGTYRFSRLVDQARAGLRLLGGRLGADPRRLALFGFSMGGWTAVNLGGRVRLRAVAAVAPVGGPEMVTGGTRGFILRSSRPLRIESGGALYRDFVRSVRSFDPAAAARRIRCPLLLVHGDADDLVPAACSRRIFAAAAGPKRLVLARGAGHSFLDRRPWLTRLVAGWLEARLK